MSDFIQNFRSGRDKRYDRGRRQYINPQFRDADWRNNNDQKKMGHRKTGGPDQTAAIRQLLEGIAKNQERLAIAEERKAEAIERIADLVKHLAVPKFTWPEKDGPEKDGIDQESVPDIEVTAQKAKEAGKLNKVDRKVVIDTISDMRKNGSTYGEIAQQLESNQISTFSGKGKWCAQTIHRLHRQNNKEEN